jgi:hypothetical protein
MPDLHVALTVTEEKKVAACQLRTLSKKK